MRESGSASVLNNSTKVPSPKVTQNGTPANSSATINNMQSVTVTGYSSNIDLPT